MDDSGATSTQSRLLQLRNSITLIRDALMSGEVIAADVTRSINEIRKDWDELALLVPSYDQRLVEEELKSLQTVVSATKTRKPKFAFKKANSATKPSPSTLESPTLSAPAAVSSSDSSTKTLTSPPASATHRLEGPLDSFLSLENLDLPLDIDDAEQVGYGSLVISNLSACFVDLDTSSASLPEPKSKISKGFEAIYLYNVRESVVLLPDTNNGSIMIHGCTGCRFILAAHQFRMHSSSGCTIQARIGSTPIVEDCSALIFSDYPVELATISFLSSVKKVQDFDFPFASEINPSPNYSIDSAPTPLSSAWLTTATRKVEWKSLLRDDGKLA